MVEQQEDWVCILSFLNANCGPDYNFLWLHLGIEKLIEESDVVISGEGKLDQDSFGVRL